MQQPVRAEIRDEVVSRLGEVAEQVVATIAEQVPTYAALSRDQTAEVFAIAEWGTRRVLDLWVEGGGLSAADVARFRGIGAARALDGRPLPGVLRAYRLAGNQVADLVEQVGGGRLTAADAMALSRLWMATIDTLSEALYAGHSAAADRVSGDRARALADLLDDLLLGRQVTRTGLADRSRELGIALGPRVGLLVVAPADDAALAAFLAEQAPDATLGRVRDGTGAALLPEAPDDAAVRDRGWRACHVPDVRVADLPRAHRLAEQALSRAPERAFAARAVLGEADAHVLALLHADGDADPERLATLVLGGLRSGGPGLVEGLAAYVETGSATEAAARLGLHPQTMRHRLRRVAELTGRDPRGSWDRFVLETALVVSG